MQVYMALDGGNGLQRKTGSGDAGSTGAQQIAAASIKGGHLNQIQGSSGAMHSISDEEREAFAEHINNVLGEDPFFQGRLPMDTKSPTALFDQCKVRPLPRFLPSIGLSLWCFCLCAMCKNSMFVNFFPLCVCLP
jgi:hypothetical protein